MHLYASAILTDHLNRLLLMTPADTGLLAPPTTALAPGSLPETQLAGYVREQTGLIILPVRLTGLSFGRQGKADSLTFTFRCLMRGGGLAAEAATTAGFFDAAPLPGPMLTRDRERVAGALRHAGGPPDQTKEPGDIASAVRGWLAGGTKAIAGAEWRAEAGVEVRDAAGRVAVRADAPGQQPTPAEAVRPGEAPWVTAVRLLAPFGLKQIAGLPVVIFDRESPRITFLFSAGPVSEADLPAGYRFSENTALPADDAHTVFRLSDAV